MWILHTYIFYAYNPPNFTNIYGNKCIFYNFYVLSISNKQRLTNVTCFTVKISYNYYYEELKSSGKWHN